MSAVQGYAPAQFALGSLYDSGKGEVHDPAEAVYWYTLAARQGEPDAQLSLANAYRKGQGIERDDAEAARWYLL